MSTTDWVEERLERRRQAALARVANRDRAKRRKRRSLRRDMARAMLAVSILMLGVLVVEIGRKAAVILNHAYADAQVSDLARDG